MARDELFAQSWAGRPFRDFPKAASEFGIADEDNRPTLTQHILGLPLQRTVSDTDRYRLVVVGSPPLTYLCMVEKPDWLVSLVRCHTTPVDFLGGTVAEIGVWRDNRSAAVQGTTDWTFDEYLAADFPVLVSDGELDQGSANYWVRRLAIAAHRGHRVGLADFRTGTVEWRQGEYRDWINARRRAWPNLAPDNLRFVITASAPSLAPTHSDNATMTPSSFLRYQAYPRARHQLLKHKTRRQLSFRRLLKAFYFAIRAE